MTDIEIVPFCKFEPDEIQVKLASIPVRLKIGGTYVNGLGETRRIVEFTNDTETYGEYQFIDDHGWTYMEMGVYDLHDTMFGDPRYDLKETG